MLTAAESGCASVSAKAVTTSVQPHLALQLMPRLTELESRSCSHLSESSDINSLERPVTPRPMASCIYMAQNRNRNIEIIQEFAQNTNLMFNSRQTRSVATVVAVLARLT